LSKEPLLIHPGTLLLSEPFMQDPLFGRAVVLVCHHDEEGSFGLILNKPAANPFEEETDHPMSKMPFFAGGPVETNSMFFIHPLSYLKECILIRDGWYWQGKYEDLLEAMEESAFTPENGRLFVGYAGWGEGQLQAELEREDWMVYNGPLDEILKLEPDQLWKTLLQKMGPYFRMVSNFPTDPSLN
jgi:putative transcriptional regulator